MDNTNLGMVIAFVSFAGVVFTALNQTLNVWLKDYLDKRKRARNNPSLQKKMEYYLQADRLCMKLRKQLTADHVSLAHFHNGGQFKSGVGIDKFTVISEDYTDHTGISSLSMYNSTLLSYAPFTFHKLLTEGFYGMDDAKCISDKALKKDLTSRNIHSVYLFAINDLNKEPLGFIEVAYIAPHTLSAEDRIVVWGLHNDFLNVITMRKSKI